MNVRFLEVSKIYLESSIVYIPPPYIQVMLKAEFSICTAIKWIQDAPVACQQAPQGWTPSVRIDSYKGTSCMLKLLFQG